MTILEMITLGLLIGGIVLMPIAITYLLDRHRRDQRAERERRVAELVRRQEQRQAVRRANIALEKRVRSANIYSTPKQTPVRKQESSYAYDSNNAPDIDTDYSSKSSYSNSDSSSSYSSSYSSYDSGSSYSSCDSGSSSSSSCGY